MIFVTVGTQKFQMNRLMKAVEKLAIEMPEQRIVVQYGNSTLDMPHCEMHQFLDRAEFEKYISCCDILITHGGVGTVMQGLKLKKKVIVVPRLKDYDEHVDDHQLEASRALRNNKCVIVCMNVEYLGFIVKNIDNYLFGEFIEPKARIEDIVENYIETGTAEGTDSYGGNTNGTFRPLEKLFQAKKL